MSCKLKTVALFLQIITNVLLSRPFGNIVYLLLKHRTIPFNSFVFPMVETQSEPGHMYKIPAYDLSNEHPTWRYRISSTLYLDPSFWYTTYHFQKAPNIRGKKSNKQPASLQPNLSMGALHNYKQGCFNIYTEIQKLYMRQLFKGISKTIFRIRLIDKRTSRRLAVSCYTLKLFLCTLLLKLLNCNHFLSRQKLLHK